MAWDVEVTFYREIELKTESHTFQLNRINPRNTECPLCQYYKKSKPFLSREKTSLFQQVPPEHQSCGGRAATAE